jgi:hypothetical protein
MSSYYFSFSAITGEPAQTADGFLSMAVFCGHHEEPLG